MSEKTFDSVAQQLSPDVYQALKRSVELRKWPDGRKLSKEQIALCLEAVLKYEIEHGVPEEQRTGYIDRTNHRDKAQPDEHDEPSSEIKWVNE